MRRRRTEAGCSTRAVAALLAALVLAAGVPSPATGADSSVTKREKKVRRVLLEPAGYEKVVLLVSDHKEYKYFKFTPGAPLALEVLGPTKLAVKVRLLFDTTMKGTQDFSLRIDEKGLLDPRKEVGAHRLKARKSTVAILKDDAAIVPAKAETFDLVVPSGRHTYSVTLGGGLAAAIVRIEIPKKDLLANRKKQGGAR